MEEKKEIKLFNKNLNAEIIIALFVILLLSNITNGYSYANVGKVETSILSCLNIVYFVIMSFGVGILALFTYKQKLKQKLTKLLLISYITLISTWNIWCVCEFQNILEARYLKLMHGFITLLTNWFQGIENTLCFALFVFALFIFSLLIIILSVYIAKLLKYCKKIIKNSVAKKFYNYIQNLSLVFCYANIAIVIIGTICRLIHIHAYSAFWYSAIYYGIGMLGMIFLPIALLLYLNFLLIDRENDLKEG